MDSFVNQSEYQILCKDHLKDWQFSWLPLQRHVCYKRHWIPQCHWREWWRCRSAWLEQGACASAHLPLMVAEQSTATYTGKERKAKVKKRESGERCLQQHSSYTNSLPRTGFITYSYHQQAIEKVFTEEYVIWKTGSDLHQHTISNTLIYI